ncbi:MAG: FAD-binding oxidoreductase [Anaerolineae bacterium]|nr:FAD-binding oxidoreductase [Anaerolineae bacterium]
MSSTESTAPKKQTFMRAVEMLEAGLTGQLIRPGDSAYEQARRVWNGRINKYPALIARCRTAQDVVLAVNFARDYAMPVAVRGGGCNSNGFATLNNGLVIDLSPCKGITVDAVTRIARAEAGLTVGELSRALQLYGLATTTAIWPGAGISGATLGGGSGWLAGKYGLAIDNVLAFELVTVAGHILRTSATENPDLFWGLRGGGGNFGIVTAIEYQLHPLESVLAGMVVYPLTNANSVLTFYRDFSSSSPDDVTAYAFLATAADVGPVVMIMAGYFGDNPTAGERLLAPVRQFGPPHVDRIQPMTYADFLEMLAWMMPEGRHYYEPAYTVRQFSNEALKTLITWSERMSSPFSAILIHPRHGAATRIAPEATAFALREPHYVVVHMAGWDEGLATDHVNWAQASVAAMQPFAGSELDVNFIWGEDEDTVRAAYRANYDRLAALKISYDPTNFFRLNQNIKPISSTLSGESA